jgi:hypothetical protein
MINIRAVLLRFVVIQEVFFSCTNSQGGIKGYVYEFVHALFYFKTLPHMAFNLFLTLRLAVDYVIIF